MGCHKYSQVVVLFSASLSLKMCSSQGIFCEYMIRGTTALVFNLTLALKNVTDSNHPPHPPLLLLLHPHHHHLHHHHHCRLQRPIPFTLRCSNAAFILSWMAKKKKKKITTYSKKKKTCQDNLILTRHYSLWSVVYWTHTAKGSLYELPPLLPCCNTTCFSVRAICTRTSSLSCEMICSLLPLDQVM